MMLYWTIQGETSNDGTGQYRERHPMMLYNDVVLDNTGETSNDAILDNTGRDIQ